MPRIRWQALVLPLTLVCAALGIWAAAIPLAHTPTSRVEWLRAGCCVLVLLGLVGAQYFVRRRVSARMLTVALLGVTLLAAVFTVDHGIRRHYMQPRQTASWSFFHYYLGGKYFKELGYDGLYEEVLKADGNGRFSAVTRYRDMGDYQLASARSLKRQPRREAWTDARWREFTTDVQAIGRLERKSFWRGPLIDRGYNPPPGWVLFGGTLAKLFSPDSGLGMTAMMLADPFLLLLAFWYSTRVYGLWRSLLVLSGGALWIGSYRLFGGKLVQYDWLAAMWGGLACMKRERWAAAGVLIAYATSVRIFPFVLFVGPGLQGLWHLVRLRRPPRSVLRFAASGAIALTLLVGLSGVAGGRGVAGWGEFASSISEHNFHHKYTETRVGWPYMTTLSFETGLSNDVPRSLRKVIYEENTAIRIAGQALLMLLLVAAAKREDAHDVAVLGLLVLFAFAVSSRYYGVVYCLLLLRHVGQLEPVGAPRVRALFALDLLFFLVTLVGYGPTLFGGDPREVYLSQGIALLVLLVASAIAGLASTRPQQRPVETPALAS